MTKIFSIHSKLSYFLIISLIMILVGIFINNIEYGWSDQNNFKNAVLKQHNYYRGIAGIPLMTWNDDIAASAQKWADTLKMSRNCRMKHSSHSFRRNVGGFSYIGENLYWAWSSRGVTVDAKAGKKAVNSWYAEIGDFQYSKQGVVCPKRGRRRAIGHFTQVMWDKSTNLGCGISVCSGKSMVIVCQYGPGGNFNQRTNPPFDEQAAKKLHQHPVNSKYNGLPRCDK